MLPLRRSARRAATRRPVRTLAGAAASALVAATLAVTGALGAAAATSCPPVGDYKNLHNGTSLGSDDNVNVYVGGDLSVAGGGAEAEGLVVVGGDMTISSGYYNLGVAGVGSRVPPAAMSDMLVTGGSVIVSSGTLDVGNGIGGNIVAGGTVTGTNATSGGTVTQNAPSPLAPYAGIPSRITQASAQYAALAPTGTVVTQWGTTTFEGDDTSAVQVFEVAGDQLGTMAAPSSQNFTKIPAGATIIINVTGSTAVVASNGTQLAGVSINPTSTTDFTFSRLTQSILWNFPTATSVTLGKSDQLLGSVLVPSAASTLTVRTSTNGRILTNGDLVQGGGPEVGLEFHSFPFRGASGCTIAEGAPTGGFSVSKTLSNPDGVPGVPTDFTVEYSIDGGTNWTQLPVAVGTPATVTGLAAGTHVTLREVPPADVTGGDWAAPSWSATNITIAAGSMTAVGVTNLITAEPTLTGGIRVSKTLVNPDGVPGVPTDYTVEYSIDGGDNWTAITVVAGGSTDIAGLPVGTVVQLREVAPTGVAGGVWSAPVWSAEQVTIAAGAPASVTVTNTIGEEPAPTTGGFSVTKSLSNPDAVPGVPTDFTVEYSIDGGDNWTALPVTVGTPATVAGLAAGTVVQLRETAPSTVAGGVWATESWSDDEITIAGGATTPVTLTNAISAAPGGFTVTKALSNPAGLTGLPADYTVEYSSDGGTAWVPLTVAVGAPATVSGLPAGTRVLLREPAPAAVAGGLWRTPVWSDDDITIVAGATTSVTVTNTLDAVLDPAFSTVAWVDDDGVTKQLPLTGGTVTDRISYSGLTAGTSYRFDGWLMRADGGTGTPIGISQSATFTPTAASGTLTMDWIISSAVAAANAGQRVVIYLELYEVGGAVAPIASDLDIDNPTEWFTLAAAPGTTQRPGPGDPGDPLASTGVDLGGLPGLAALLLGGGALLLGIIRHRRRRTAG